MSERIHDDFEVGSSLGRAQKGGYPRFPPAVAYSPLPHSEPFGIGTIKIRAVLQAQRPYRFQKAGDERIDLRNVADGHWPTDMMVGAVGKGRIVFRAKKVREQLGVAPASGAGRGPVVVVAGMATRVDHAVGGTRASQHASPRQHRTTVVAVWLRYCLVSPAELWIQDREGNGSRYPDEREACLLYTSPSPRDRQKSRMPSSA